jgi:hypothetical protein
MTNSGRFYRIDEETKVGHLTTCLYYQDPDLAKMTEEEIAALVERDTKARIEGHVAFVTEQSSKPPVKPKAEDLKAQADQLKDQWSRMVAQLSEVGTKEDIQAVADKLDLAVAETAASVEATPIKVKDPIKEVDPIEEVKP